MVDQLRVGKDERKSSHDFSLENGSERWYFDLADLNIDEAPLTPNTIFDAGGKGSQFGDFTADHAHLLQRDWGGGRGQEEWEDNTQYFDSRMAWTLIPGRVTPVPQFRYAEGLRFAENLLPGGRRYNVGDDVNWLELIDQTKYARSMTIQGDDNWDAALVEFWVRKVGNPDSTITVEIHGDSTGDPDDTPVFSATLSNTDITDVLSELVTVEDTSSPPTLVAGTKYWVVVYSSANDSSNNHWEIGVGGGAADQCKVSTGAWGNTEKQIYFRVRSADPVQQYIPFNFDGSGYLVSTPRDDTASKIWINGDRGIADASSSTTLEDATKTWATDLWANARVRIIRGLGIGQTRLISSNDADTLTISEAWDITPDTTSEYVLIGTDEFSEVTPTSGDLFDDAVRTVAVADDQVFFGYGTGSGDSVILRMRNNAGVHEFDDDPGSNKSDVLAVHYDAASGAQLWSGENDDVIVRRSDVTAWAAALAFKDDIDVGEDTHFITNIISSDGRVWIFKEDQPWYLQNDVAIPVDVGLEAMAEPENGLAALSWKRHLYYGWAFSIEKLVGQNVDDVGPWLRAGLPSARRGKVLDLAGVNAFLACGIDAGPDRRSSVLFWNEIGYGELYRAPADGRRIRHIHWNSVPGGPDQLWIEMGGDVVIQTFPEDSLNFLHVDNFVMHHEWVVESSTYDMQAQQLSKLFKELSLTTKNLDQEGTEIYVDYQLDKDVGSSKWFTIGSFVTSPHQTEDIGEGRRKSIRLRIRGMSNDADVPAVLLAAVLQGMARLPVKYQRVFRASTKRLASSHEGQKADPDAFVEFIKGESGEAGELTLRASSGFPWLDETEVIVQPPQTFRAYADRTSGKWTGVVAFAVRDA